AGVSLGVMFFGGLCWTVRRGVVSPRPVLWFFGSLVLRMSITLGGFYFVGGGDWRRLVTCLAGFVMARLVVTRLTRPMSRARLELEAAHAPES
ncbi:MAG: ATP synthase subunit I, partial [Dokdonella sp.]